MDRRPFPSQIPHDDQVILRRELKQMIPGDVALDREELTELLDLSNQGGRFDALRLKLLRRAINQLAADDVLRTEQFLALRDYREGRGPRPAFALLVTADGHYIGASVLPMAEQRPETLRPAPREDPDETGRYVRPSGPFASPGDPGFSPDRR